MNEVMVRRWPWWCCFTWIVVIIVVMCCWWWPRPAADCFEANLIILDETTAAWVTTNNTFADGLPDPGKPRSYWTGILFQLGYADGAERTFHGIQFYSGGSMVGELFRDDVAWVNIVADVSGVDDPMLETHYPLIDGECEVIDGCESCRRLHHLLDPSAVMTYWQGPGGIAIEMEQSTGSFNASNEQRFDFKDDFSVTCYKTKSDGTLEEISGFVFGVGDIDEIRVTHETGPPGGGVKQDPAWPGP